MPLAVKHMFHRYLSLTEHKNRSTPIVQNECPFFSPFHTQINTRMDLLIVLPLLYSPYSVLRCVVQKLYSSPTHLCASKHCTAILSFSTVHSAQCLIARSGLSICSYKTRHISRQLFHVANWFRALSKYIDLQNTIVYGSSPIELAGGSYERHAKTYGTTFVFPPLTKNPNFSEEINKPSELIIKLEVAFLSGLRCTNPVLRNKFFEIFDASIPRKLIFRLLYIVSSQNWEGMAQHYWLKQCIELILVTSVCGNNFTLF